MISNQIYSYMHHMLLVTIGRLCCLVLCFASFILKIKIVCNQIVQCKDYILKTNLQILQAQWHDNFVQDNSI